jgi:diguanylate cyclase (GGDEF)-like protein
LHKFFNNSYLGEDKDYLDEKLESNRNLTEIFYILGSLLGMVFWIWDYVIDSVGAYDTIYLRLGFLVILLGAIIFKYSNNKYMLLFTFPLLAVFTEVLFFMILAIMPTLLLQGFSFSVSIVNSVFLTLLPHILAETPFFEGFLHFHYAVMLWPSMMMILITQYFLQQKDFSRYKSERKLELISNSDYLTGLNNRRHFMLLLKQEFLRTKRYGHIGSLLMIDIDHFKSVNDTYGHLVGDFAIRACAENIVKSTRNTDIISRFGGEEFIVFLPEIDREQTLIIAERIRLNIENNFIVTEDNKKFSMTVSIGMVQQDKDEISENDLIFRADKSLYQAKKLGRNRIY